MLLEGGDPASILQTLDSFAATIPGADGTTIVCAIVDRAAATITYASAGHLPALVVGGAGHRWLNQAQGLPLAVHPAATRTNVTEPLEVGDVIVLYTDGLVERRGELIDIGLARLSEAAEALRGATVQPLADGLLAAVAPASPRDDVVLLVKHFDGS
jgi:serine phosphatase RsbU (regulator of sigma subunit)